MKNRLKLKYLVLYVFFCSTSNLFSQTNATYLFVVNKGVSGTLQLNDRYNYEININYSLSEDNSFSFLLSKGNYSQSNDTLKLFDSFNQYSLTFKMDRNIKRNKVKLMSIKSFRWMSNLVIEKISDISNIEKNAKTNKHSIQKLRKVYANNTQYTLYYAEYKDFDFSYCNIFKLKLIKPNTYKLSFFEFVFSEGTFTKNKNEIKLNDNSINHDFYCFILKKYLSCQFAESPISLRK